MEDKPDFVKRAEFKARLVERINKALTAAGEPPLDPPKPTPVPPVRGSEYVSYEWEEGWLEE